MQVTIQDPAFRHFCLVSSSWEAWNINSVHSSNRDACDLLPDTYLYLSNKNERYLVSV